MKLNSLIDRQHLKIDNHHPGTPFRWDWNDNETIDDIHLDKTYDEKVNGKWVKIRVSLNNDFGITEPKKCERNDLDWMARYHLMKKEVTEVLNKDVKAREQFVKDISKSIKEIGPNKERRAIRKALARLASYFGLEPEMLQETYKYIRGTASLYLKNQKKYYVGFGNDYNFYIGEGNGGDFSKRVYGN